MIFIAASYCWNSLESLLVDTPTTWVRSKKYWTYDVVREGVVPQVPVRYKKTERIHEIP